MRLRRGKLCAIAGVRSGNSEITRPSDADPLRQRAVAGWIDGIDASADDRDRRSVAVGIERSTMCRGVDAERQTADDRDARARQRTGEGFGVGDALLRGVAAADNRERRPVQQFDTPDRKQHGRGIRRVEQQPRILAVRERRSARG